MTFRLGFLALALEAISAVALLATSSYLISRAAEQPPIMYLMMAVVGVRAFALGRASFRYLQRLGLHDSVLQKLATLRPLVFQNLAKLRSVDARSLLERVTSDVERVPDWSLRVLAPVAQSVIGLLITAILVAVWFPLSAVAVTAISLVTCSAVFAVSYLATSSTERRRQKGAEDLKELLIEALSSTELIRSYGLQGYYQTRIKQLGSTLAGFDKRRGEVLGIATALFGSGALLASTSAALFSEVQFSYTMPHMLALAVLTPFAFFDIASNLQQAAIALHGFNISKRRLERLTKQPLTRTLGRTLDHLTKIELTDVEIRRGEFRVGPLNLAIEARGITVLTGRSGSGKTSIALALLGLLDYSGSIELNGSELGEIEPSDLRKYLTLIEQHPMLFSGSVYENLAVSGELERPKQLAALTAVGLDSELSERGLLDAQIGERGSNLSGGQAQRLALARAILRGSEFIILDEPTSSLDWDNSVLLASKIKALNASGVGFLLISHDTEFAALFDDARVLNLSSD